MKKSIQIIGAGTSGIQLQKTILNSYDVTIFEKGDDPKKRKIDYGFGGSGTFSDGKLTYSTKVGGQLVDILQKKELLELSRDQINFWLDGRDENDFDNFKFNYNNNKDFIQKLENNGFEIIESDFLHLGTENMVKRSKELYQELSNQIKIELLTEIKLKDILNMESEFDYVVFQCGRSGWNTLKEYLDNKNLSYQDSILDIGIRYEFPDSITKDVTDKLYEFKVQKNGVRTFCVNPGGMVVNENGLANGHSFLDVKKKTNMQNMAILKRLNITGNNNYGSEYFKKIMKKIPKKYKNEIMFSLLKDVHLENNVSDVSIKNKTHNRFTSNLKELGLTYIKQKYDDITHYYESKLIQDIYNFINDLGLVIEGFNNENNILYFPEIKTNTITPEFIEPFFVKENIIIIGDVSGLTRGITQQTQSGLYIGRKLIELDCG